MLKVIKGTGSLGWDLSEIRCDTRNRSPYSNAMDKETMQSPKFKMSGNKSDGATPIVVEPVRVGENWQCCGHNNC